MHHPHDRQGVAEIHVDQWTGDVMALDRMLSGPDPVIRALNRIGPKKGEKLTQTCYQSSRGSGLV